MSSQFNPGVDSIPDDKLLFYFPDKDKKAYRSIEVEPVDDSDIDALLKRLLLQSKAAIFTELEEWLNKVLAYFEMNKAVIITIIVGFFSIYILEYFTHYLFGTFKELQIEYMKKLDDDQPGHYYFKKRTKVIKIKPSKAEVKQYLRCKKAIEEVLFV